MIKENPTLQEVLDYVCEHLVKQGEPCKSETGNCRYRDSKGRTCAVGCLISEESYDPVIEGSSVTSLWNGSVTPRDLLGFPTTSPMLRLLEMLQIIHDNTYTEIKAHWVNEVARWVEVRLPDFNEHHDQNLQIPAGITKILNNQST